ncbi:MAG: 16S rRNA (adenine(1518)-N(6)/adenine(1519)-N(6))-dimethyltransferase RsmA, partial [Clostridia bacterium]
EALLADICNEAEVDKCSVVLEIGTGAGSLTRELARNAKKVFTVEIDNNLSSVLQETLFGLDNVKVIYDDIMRLGVSGIEHIMAGERYSLEANIPYYITSPLILMFLSKSTKVDKLTLMVQKEVADRLIATAGTKEYGVLTVLVQSLCDARLVRSVSRKMFTPQPDVDSAVVSLAVRMDKYNIKDRSAFEKCVKCGFSMRRKTLVNCLQSGYSLTKEQAQRALIDCQLPITARGETLTVTDYINLTETLKNKNEPQL